MGSHKSKQWGLSSLRGQIPPRVTSKVTPEHSWTSREERKPDPGNWGRPRWESGHLSMAIPITDLLPCTHNRPSWAGGSGRRRGRPQSLDRDEEMPWTLNWPLSIPASPSMPLPHREKSHFPEPLSLCASGLGSTNELAV